MRDALPPLLRDTPDDLARVVRLLRTGEIVALPTETVYGLAADALNEAAVRRIFEAKGRPLLDPLIVHIAAPSDAGCLAETSPALQKLAERFWPGPLTVVLPKKAIVPDLVTAGMLTVAVRCPAHPLMRRVLELSGLFLAAPSANPFGYISPTSAAHVRASLGVRAPWILDGGECQHGLESTIVLLTDAAHPRLLRPGPVSREELESALGVAVECAAPGKGATPEQPEHVGDFDTQPQLAPGMLLRHYSPNTRVALRAHGTAPALCAANAAVREAVVWLRRPAVPTRGAEDFWFSETGNLAEVGRNVFALLRRLDTGFFSTLHVELTDGAGIGAAINDRLRRAAAKAG